VVAVEDPAAGGTRIDAYVACNALRPSIIDLKRFSAEHLPAYLVPDRFVFDDALPQTSTGKTDYQALIARSRPPPPERIPAT
jgi:non-ribosomal peptide synthetase component E (peptide arylation enzyme)